MNKSQPSSGSFINVHLYASLVALFAAAFLFVLIATDVVNGGAGTLLDTRLGVWLHAHSTPQLTTFFWLISRLHSDLGVGLVTLALCAYLWTKHLRTWVLTLLLSVFGGILLNALLKNLFLRPRPSFSNAIPRLTTFSFPSGHTMLATVFYGSLCAFLFARTRSPALRTLDILLAVMMIVLVGVSRIYLGAHYLTDVLGAMAEGLGWLAACFLIVGILRKRRGQKRSNQVRETTEL